MERLPYFARLLATLGYAPQDFEAMVLWFAAWGIWNVREESIGYRLVEGLNQAAGQPASFETKPIHEFRGDELTEAVGMLLQPMIFGWDSYCLPRFSYGVEEYFIFVSHDSYVVVVMRTEDFRKKALKELEQAGFAFRTASERILARFCHHAVR